jgi:hypothetical protein
MPSRSRPLPGARALAAPITILALWLAGCATPLAIQPGTPEAEVRARLGAPTAVYPLDGQGAGTRLEYAKGHYGQRTFMVDLDEHGLARHAWQALTDAHFAQIRPGVDTAASIRRDFGTPARIVTYRLSGLTAWEYPYRQAESWDAVMSVYFDAAGVVQRMESGPDPDREPRDGGRHGGHDHGGHDRR